MRLVILAGVLLSLNSFAACEGVCQYDQRVPGRAVRRLEMVYEQTKEKVEQSCQKKCFDSYENSDCEVTDVTCPDLNSAEMEKLN